MPIYINSDSDNDNEMDWNVPSATMGKIFKDKYNFDKINTDLIECDSRLIYRCAYPYHLHFHDKKNTNIFYPKKTQKF
jgi:hypothetical protein